MPRPYAIEPMTLTNMRANGVRSLLVYCTACPRTVVVNVDAYPDSAGAGVRAAHGLHRLRHHRRRRAAELERESRLPRVAGPRELAPF